MQSPEGLEDTPFILTVGQGNFQNKIPFPGMPEGEKIWGCQ
jgi:hypothetical protein